LQAAAIAPEDLVLEVGCGPGYQSAVASRLAAVVVGLESDSKLAATARETLSELAFDGVTIVDGDLRVGLSKQSPFDVIVFGGAIPFIPTEIIDQLAEGGRLVAVVRQPGEHGKIVSLLKTNGAVSKRVISEAAIPVLPGFDPEPVFQF
jgi:protein-L-isoaspartate(D-aspartate) O-methyltransferase